LIGPSLKKLKLWRLPQIEDSIERWAKHMGLKRGLKGNILGEHTGNLMGTHWGLEGNIKGTYSEERKNEKIPPSPPPKT
jgi:hypothetical protein